MDKQKFSETWEVLSNDLYVDKLRTFVDIPRVSIEAMNVIGEEGVQQIDGYFKDRRKIKNFSEVINKGKIANQCPEANSEIFINKKTRHEIYCFNGVVLPEEKYVNPDEIKCERTPGYTIMLLSELFSENIKQVFISHDMNNILGKIEGELRIKRMQEKFRKGQKQ